MGRKSGLADKVERDLGLWEQLVPMVVGKGRVNPCNNEKELVFEGADGLLGNIAAVDIWDH